VATRTIRPTGLIQVQAGTEAEFLIHQDIAILPGMGPGLLRTAAVTGMREIGDIAALSVTEALSIFGKQGPLLRSMAQGIDGSCVEERKEERRITRRADFDEDVIEETVIRGALISLAGHGGLEMRRDKLGAGIIRLAVVYNDGVRAEGKESFKRPCVLDRDIAAAAERIFRREAVRRLRIRSMGLSLEGLVPLGYVPDLFEVQVEAGDPASPLAQEAKNRRLQEALDRIQTRHGMGAVMRGMVFTASCLAEGRRSIPALQG